MPLLSDIARGKLADVMVFFPWKGLACVRKYVIPANPRTSAQQTVRSYVREAVLQWRTLGYLASDKTAYNNWALILVDPMSGFTAYMRNNLTVRNAGLQYSYPFAFEVASPSAGVLVIKVKVKDNIADYTVTGYYDTKQRGTLNSVNIPWDSVNYWYYTEITGLPSGVAYWVWVKVQKTGYDGETGDLKQVIS